MNEQHEEAAKAVALAKQAIDQGLYDKAVRLLEKSLRMRKTAEAETLLTAAQRGVARQEAKANPLSAEAAAAAAAPQQRAFTKEQEEGCRRILLCKTHYEALGIEKQSSQDEIKKSYRKLALRFHPDKCGAPKAEEAFKKLNKAFEVLSNEDDRAHYDRYGDADPRGGGGGGGGHGHAHHHHNPFQGQEMDVDDILRFFMQGGGGMNFGGGRAFRPQAQRQQQQRGGGGAGGEVQQISLQQILFFIVSMYFMFSSFGSPAASQASAAAKHQNNLYSLFPTQQYNVHRKTAMRGVVGDIPYYVEPRFGNSIGKSPKDLYYVETSVESAQHHLLSERCRDDRKKTRQANPSSCVKLDEFEVKKKRG